MPDMDSIIRQSLREFVADVFAHSWWGKEREAVSLFAFGYLIRQCRPGSALFDPAQIGIEVSSRGKGVGNVFMTALQRLSCEISHVSLPMGSAESPAVLRDIRSAVLPRHSSLARE